MYEYCQKKIDAGLIIILNNTINCNHACERARIDSPHQQCPRQCSACSALSLDDVKVKRARSCILIYFSLSVKCSFRVRVNGKSVRFT